MQVVAAVVGRRADQQAEDGGTRRDEARRANHGGQTTDRQAGRQAGRQTQARARDGEWSQLRQGEKARQAETQRRREAGQGRQRRVVGGRGDGKGGWRMADASWECWDGAGERMAESLPPKTPALSPMGPLAACLSPSGPRDPRHRWQIASLVSPDSLAATNTTAANCARCWLAPLLLAARPLIVCPSTPARGPGQTAYLGCADCPAVWRRADCADMYATSSHPPYKLPYPAYHQRQRATAFRAARVASKRVQAGADGRWGEVALECRPPHPSTTRAALHASRQQQETRRGVLGRRAG